MKLVMLLVVRDEADIVDAQIAFHLGAGVDLVLATDLSAGGATEILESYSREGHLHRLADDTGDGSNPRATMARLAIDEHGADWVIDSETDEFWFPRAESIKDVLVAIPPRYGIVQGLSRVFLPRPEDGRPFAERMTVRRPLTDIREDESAGHLDWALRPIHRAAAGNFVVGGDREATLDGRVPLRAWYPIEVLRFPIRGREQAERRTAGLAGPPESRSRIEQALFEAKRQGVLGNRWADFVVDDADLERRLVAGSLVVDERLRTALDELERTTTGRLSLPTPTVVDDAAYAGECAAVREVDFEPLRDRIAQLERRIADLEKRFWPRVRRRLTGFVRR